MCNTLCNTIMTITVRIDDELVAALDRAAARQGIARSELVRRAVRRYCGAGEEDRAPTPAALAAGLLGSLRSGRGDLSTTSREELTRLVRDRARRRPR
jgi:predicted transcriptional regulator